MPTTPALETQMMLGSAVSKQVAEMLFPTKSTLLKRNKSLRRKATRKKFTRKTSMVTMWTEEEPFQILHNAMPFCKCHLPSFHLLQCDSLMTKVILIFNTIYLYFSRKKNTNTWTNLSKIYLAPLLQYFFAYIVGVARTCKIVNSVDFSPKSLPIHLCVFILET